MDLADVTLETFKPHLGESFQVQGPGDDWQEMTLERIFDIAQRLQEEIDPLLYTRKREPFNLWFKGPPGEPLPQETYRFQHAELGEFALFLVPIGAQPGHVVYEVVFG